MTQDEVKKLLLRIEDTQEFFSVVFTGKKSKKVDGLYYPEKHEIIIHNRNMDNDNELMYTAVHEYAHHVHYCSSCRPSGARAHTRDFWNIFHSLLEKAESLGIFRNFFREIPEFTELTKKLKEHFISRNGSLMKEFGALLIEAMKLCRVYHASFDDYVDRELGLHRNTAKTLIDVFKKDIVPSIGFENMKAVSRIRDEDTRKMAENAFMQGQSPDRVLHQVKNALKPEKDAVSFLQAEKKRLEKTIESLSKRLKLIEAELAGQTE